MTAVETKNEYIVTSWTIKYPTPHIKPMPDFCSYGYNFQAVDVDEMIKMCDEFIDYIEQGFIEFIILERLNDPIKNKVWRDERREGVFIGCMPRMIEFGAQIDAQHNVKKLVDDTKKHRIKRIFVSKDKCGNSLEISYFMEAGQ